MDFMGREFPALMSASAPETTSSPTLRPTGAIMYLLSPSRYFRRAMRAERLGSYSMVSTTAGTSNLLRLKSIILYERFAPPPRCHTVMRPLEFRPPDFLRGFTSGA